MIYKIIDFCYDLVVNFLSVIEGNLKIFLKYLYRKSYDLVMRFDFIIIKKKINQEELKSD